MVLDNVENFVRTGVRNGISNGDTIIPVPDASVYPDPSVSNYNVVIWDSGEYARADQDPNVEVMRVTARDTTANELTVSRGQEGTVESDHPASSDVILSPTAKMFSDIDSTIESFWDDSNNELTADVNNQSVQTEEVGIGDASPVTGGPIGNQGDWIWLGNVEVLEAKSAFSSTSTTWDGLSWAVGKNPIPSLSDLSATNIKVYGELSAEQRHSGSHGQFRLGSGGGTESGFEVSTNTQYSRHSSGRLPLSEEDISGSDLYRFEVKSDDGTEVQYSSVRFWLWGKVQ